MAVPFWIKLAASELVRYKIVSTVRTHNKCLSVRYKSGIKDKYYFRTKPPIGSYRVRRRDMKMGDPIPIVKMFEVNPLNKEEIIGCSHHLSMSRKDLRAGSFLDGRVAIHKFATMLTRYEPSLDRYPENTVRRWINDLREFNLDKMISSDAFNFYKYLSPRIPWRQVLWQFFPPPLDYSPREIISILTVAQRGVVPLDTITVNKQILRKAKTNTLNPLAYCAILDKLDTRDGVIDLHPGRGYKAIACGLLGIHYIYKECPEMDRALERGITNMLDMTCEPLSNQSASVLLSDGDFERFDIDGTSNYLDRVNTMIAYAPRADRLELTAKHEPSRVVKVLCRYKQGRNFKSTAEDPDFLLVW